jgi:hypothetical protein
MTTHTRTRPASAPAYYLGRPAGFWLAALAPRPTTHKSPRSSCTGDSVLFVPRHP